MTEETQTIKTPQTQGRRSKGKNLQSVSLTSKNISLLHGRVHQTSRAAAPMEMTEINDDSDTATIVGELKPVIRSNTTG